MLISVNVIQGCGLARPLEVLARVITFNHHCTLLAEAINTNYLCTHVPTQICADLISLFIQSVIVVQMGISSAHFSQF